MPKYNKLVRDKVPRLISSEQRNCSVRKLNGSELMMALRKKMLEEAKEFERAGDMDELADILEVIYAYLKAKGIEFSEIGANQDE
ncbi:MAG: nucleoside triphosphate pyrophosphohydrolase [Phycisphaerae bacterium]|nr:nucleoside triphosphate pyrophosphohydrolase [Phycisphaerae bacterium]